MMHASFAADLFDAQNWAMLPFHFWTVVFFLFGAIVGSFLNVCVHRMPRGQSLMRPGSHCPHCAKAIPLRLNLPLVSWLWLRGRCAFCGSGIPARYFLVEALTSASFAVCWVRFGGASAGLALAGCLVIAGLIAATFIDFEHFIIPDPITLGGIGAGVVCSFLVPALQQADGPAQALQRSFVGAVVGAGVIYSVVRLGKLAFGRHAIALAPGSKVVFAEDRLVLPDREVPYEELLYRRTDSVQLDAARVELVDRCCRDVRVVVTRERVRIGDAEFAFHDLPGFEAVTGALVLPREVMGLGDVKFMAAIGAFFGWPAVLFSIALSAFLGSVTGLLLIALRRHQRSAPLPYGPFIALATAVWLFHGETITRWWLGAR